MVVLILLLTHFYAMSLDHAFSAVHTTPHIVTTATAESAAFASAAKKHGPLKEFVAVLKQ